MGLARARCGVVVSGNPGLSGGDLVESVIPAQNHSHERQVLVIHGLFPVSTVTFSGAPHGISGDFLDTTK